VNKNFQLAEILQRFPAEINTGSSFVTGRFVVPLGSLTVKFLVGKTAGGGIFNYKYESQLQPSNNKSLSTVVPETKVNEIASIIQKKVNDSSVLQGSTVVHQCRDPSEFYVYTQTDSGTNLVHGIGLQGLPNFSQLKKKLFEYLEKEIDLMQQ